MDSVLHGPGLVIALALVLGMVAQALAHHLRIPGIVLLLAGGVALGPDGLGVINPDGLGPALNILTGFAVAVILFEGGLNLDFRQLRQAQEIIRRLILFGGILTLAGGALLTRMILHWSWETSILFGTLVMVTGPTVVNPLLKRLNVRRNISTVLEAEGVLIDAVGAVVAIVALEAVLGSGEGNLLVWGWHIVSRLGFGMLFGTIAAFLLITLFRIRRLIPEGTANVFTLSAVLALFQGSNAILPESGIAAVITAGIVMGNYDTRVTRDLAEFKEELTVLLIGLLFILLAADVRLEQVTSLGVRGIVVVALLMFLIRPLAVFAATSGSALRIRERAFIAWIGPRGIVAAAIASFFATAFAERDMQGGLELRALVFLVIAVTVVFAGLTGGPIATLLGLRRSMNVGWVILSASPLARALARLLKASGQPVVCIDTNPDHCLAAAGDCTEVIHGNGLQADCLQQAEIETRSAALAVTENDEVNYLFVKKVREEARDVLLYSTFNTSESALTGRMLHKADAAILFGQAVDIESWNRWLAGGQVLSQYWKPVVTEDAGETERPRMPRYEGSGLLGAVLRRKGKLEVISDESQFTAGDEACWFIYCEELTGATAYLRSAGWEPLAEAETLELQPATATDPA